jgi:hypothetical protein
MATQARSAQTLAGRTGNFAGNPKTINAGAQTVIWSSSEIDSTGVIQFELSLAGNGAANWQQLNFIDRVRVRAAGRPIIDVPLAVLQAYTAAYSEANYSDVNSGSANGALIIPLNLLDGPTMESRDQCQFPAGVEAQVEVVFTSSALAGQAILGWKTSVQVPRFFPRLISSAANWAAAAARAQKFAFSGDGIIRAIATLTAGIDRLECYVSGQRAFNKPGAVYGNPASAGATFSDMSVETDVLEEGAQVGTYRFRKTDLLIAAAGGSSYVQADTLASYAGPAGEVCIYELVPAANFRPQG